MGSLDGYDAVILGGAPYANRWPASGRRFVRRHLKALRSIPVWLFSSGPLDPSARERVIPPTTEVAAIAGRVGARGHVTFGGRLDPDAKGFPREAMAKEMAGDWRDPQHVRSWSDAIADELPTATPGEVLEPPGRALSRLLLHGIVGALLVAAVLAAAPALGGKVTLILHGILAPVLVGIVAAAYFRAPGSHDPLPTAVTFSAFLIAAEVAVIDARLYPATILDGLAFWLPLAAVFITTWGVGSLMATLPWRDPAAAEPSEPPVLERSES